MKVKHLIEALSGLNQEEHAVVQVNHGDGYFSHHEVVLFGAGHIGYHGPILTAGEAFKLGVETGSHPAEKK